MMTETSFISSFDLYSFIVLQIIYSMSLAIAEIVINLRDIIKYFTKFFIQSFGKDWK